MKNNKGTVIDSVFYVVIIFALGILAVLGYKVYDAVNTHIQNLDTIPQVGKDVSQSFANKYVTIFDYGFLMALVFLFLATVVLGAMVDTTPILFYLSSFLTLIVIVLAAIFANVFDDFRDQSAMTAYAAQFTIIPFVFEHFVPIITVFLMTVAGITYMRVKA